MYLILTLAISSAFCIEIEKECDEKWNVEYLSTNHSIKQLVIIDMTSEDDVENFDCLYRYISVRGIPIVTLFDISKPDKKFQAKINAVEKTYLYRTSSIAFIIVMPRPSENYITQCKFINVLRRYPKALTTFVFYKTEFLLLKLRRELGDTLNSFVHYVLGKQKFMKFVGILLDSDVPLFFTYDLDHFDAKSYKCGVKVARANFDYNWLVQQCRKLIENYPVRIRIFHMPPASIYVKRPDWRHFRSRLVRQLLRNRVVGIDGLLIADLVKHFKFKPVYVSKPGIAPFGMYINGTSSGALGDIMNQNIEIASNSRFITSYGANEKFYFLGYTRYDKLCVMVPKSEKLPVWIQVLQTYSILTWAILNIVAILLSLLRWMHFNLEKKRRISLFNILFETCFSIMSPISSFRHSPHRILLAVNLIVSIMFVSIFQGSFRSAFTKRKFYPSVKTLESVDKQFSKIYVPTIDSRFVFSRGINDLYDRLDSKVENINVDYIKYIQNIHSKQAVVIPLSDTQLMLNYVPGASSRLSVVRECPREYLFASICSTNFPWAEEVELAVHRLLAAGLPSWYYRMTEFTVQVITAKNATHLTPEYQSLTLNVMAGPFYVFAAGILTSLVAFVVEIVYNHYVNKHKYLKFTL